MYRQPSTTLQNSTPKQAGQNPESISQEAIYHGTLVRTFSRYKVFKKLLWKPSENALRIKCHSQYKKVSFSTVPPIVNGGDWGCIVRNLETIIVLVLLAFNFIPQRSHHPLSLPKVKDQGLCYCNSDAWRWHNSHQSRVISITDQLILQNGKSSEVYRRNNNGPKTLQSGTTDTMLTSLLWQPSTITCCDRFDKNCVNIDNTELPMPTEHALRKISVTN